MPATDTGADLIENPLNESDAENEFLKRFMATAGADEKQPPQKEDKAQEQTAAGDEDAETSEEQTEEAPAEEPGETEESETEEDEGEKRKYADDEGTYVKVKVGEEEHEVPVKDLKRLFGQEASLTKKSMEVADLRKKVDAEMATATTATAALLERAKARFQPYSQIDFMLAAKELPAEEYTALRTEAQKAFEDVAFLEQNLAGLMDGIKQKQEADLVNAARESLKVLSGPADKGGIEGWSEKLYDDIRAFAITEGAPAELMNRLVDPWAIRLIHDAMLYKRGKSKVITTKVNKTPKKVIKTSISQNSGTSPKADKLDSAMKRLQRSGREDDAEAVFLARWGMASDDQ